MNEDIKYTNQPRRGKALAGVILLIVGGALLLKQFDFFFFPNWLFSWPMWLILWGLYSGAKHNFNNSSSFILILLGIVFLVHENLNVASGFIWPMALIIFGLWIIVRRSHHSDRDNWDKPWKQRGNWRQYEGAFPNNPTVDYTTTADVPPPVNPDPSTYSRPTGDDYLDAVSIFGGVKKTILSKNFRGGEIVNVFGGAELDFTQANINGQVIIDITQIFGGTKIIVPAHWQVVSDLAAVFASVDDKRIRTAAPADSDKILVLKGTSIFAGVDIRSY